MMIQQQQQIQGGQMKKSLRPKSAKSTKSVKNKIPISYSAYNQPFLNSKRKSTGKGLKKKAVKKKKS